MEADNKGVPLTQLVKWNKYIPIIPFSNQLLFLRSNELEILYGGAARGGKSVSMLAAALQYVDIPDYHALIIRKTHTELRSSDGLIPLSKQWLMGTDAKWNDKQAQWEFPNGSTLQFGYLASDDDIYNYIGLSYQFIGFDELTQHIERNYTFLFSRLVRNKQHEANGIPLRMRATTNPNGENALWVYNRFINKATKVEIRKQVIDTIVVTEGLRPEQVTEEQIKYLMPKFIPSRMVDNPHIDQKSYRLSLEKLDPVTKKQLLEGDWEIRPAGNMFRRGWFEKVKPKFLDSRDFTRMVRYWDFAATTSADSDYTATCKMGFNRKDNNIYIFDVQFFKKVPGEIEEIFRELQRRDGIRCITVIEQEPGSAGVNNSEHYRREVSLKGYTLKVDKVSGNKIVRAQPFSGAGGNGLIKIVDYPKVILWWDDAMSQLEAFPDAEHDDIVDSMSGAFNALMMTIRRGAEFIGQLKESDINPNMEDAYAPAYMARQPKSDKVGELVGAGRVDSLFRRPYE